MACKLGICNQPDCFCGTVIHTRRCAVHSREFLRVEAVPFYAPVKKEGKHVEAMTDSRLDQGYKLVEREARKKMHKHVSHWWYVLVCPVRGCGYAKPWKSGPANRKKAS